MSEPHNILLLPIGLLAAAALISSKPSLSAMLLLIESVCIAIFLSLRDASSLSIGPSLLLSLFCLLVLCANIYIEKSTHKTNPAIPKSNIIIGALLFLAFSIALNHLKDSPIEKAVINNMPEDIFYDTFSIICLIFNVFVIIISSFIIITIKNTDSHNIYGDKK